MIKKKIKFSIKSILIFLIPIMITYGPWYMLKQNSNLTVIGNDEKKLEHLSWNVTLLESTILEEKIDLNILHDNKIELEAEKNFIKNLKMQTNCQTKK